MFSGRQLKLLGIDSRPTWLPLFVLSSCFVVYLTLAELGNVLELGGGDERVGTLGKPAEGTTWAVGGGKVSETPPDAPQKEGSREGVRGDCAGPGGQEPVWAKTPAALCLWIAMERRCQR